MHTSVWAHYPRVGASPAARAFIESCAKRQKRPKTLDAYARNLEDLFRAFDAIAPGRAIDANGGDIDTYFDLLAHRAPGRPGQDIIAPPTGQDQGRGQGQGGGLSDNTIRQRIVTARLFYDFCIRRGWRADATNPVPRGQRGGSGRSPERGPGPRQRRLPWTPPDDVWERIIRYILLRESRRNAAMVLLAYGCALRRAELVAVRLDDIDWARQCLAVRAEVAKGGRPRVVPLSPFVGLVLRRYIVADRRHILDAFGGDHTGPLFVSESPRNPGRPIGDGTFNDVIERLRAALDVPRLTPHTLRHQRCTVLKRGGMDIEDIALFAGHASSTTTQVYIHLAPVELGHRLRAAVAPFDDRIAHLIEEADHAHAPS